jgi:DNA mismatch repair ATPase MutS
MLFTTDQQTLDDLNILGKGGNDSIYQIFNRTSTRGGAVILEEMFRYPLSNEQDINHRSGIVQYFASKGMAFPFESSDFDAIEPYLNSKDERTKLTDQEHSVAKRLSNLVALDADTQAIHKGIVTLAGLFIKIKTFVATLEIQVGHPYQFDKDGIVLLLADPAFKTVFSRPLKSKWSDVELADFDQIFRFRYRDVVQKLLHHIYYLDVYLTVAKVALEFGFTFPNALPKNNHTITLEGLYHPQLKKAVSNSLEITPQSNVIFLTGANMAGKSTFMKSLSVALYLAHMGFPVAASKMEFSVLDGMYTTINLPDDLGMGASHFYAEVLRAKKVANELKNKNLFVVFDELFRGTNVKDAYEATIAFTTAFAAKPNSMFVISTHIIEAGEVLKERCNNINFLYLPTIMEGTHPVYTYKLKQGITADRHGMIIIKNEGILESLDEGKGRNIEKEEKHFVADKQTLADLNLLGKYKPNSIYSLFNKVITAGGERLLQEMFNHPLTDVEQINARSGYFSYFQQKSLMFPFSKETFALAENYLCMGIAGNYPSAITTMALKKLQASFLRDEQYEGIHNGLHVAIGVLNDLNDFLNDLKSDTGSIYEDELNHLVAIFDDERLAWLKLERNQPELSFLKVARYDYLLKHTLRRQMEFILESIYRLDVYLAVSHIARERGFAYAEALPKASNLVNSKALWHPALVAGIANLISFHQDQNMVFLTGANMAGKSTFMKAFGIAIYLAHMGFPVAAKDMQFSVMDGLYSSINVPDNLNMGYSHFYAEVLRVKTVAEEVAQGKKIIVLFDELFKGTNVKDAYDATLAVTKSFSEYRNCFFIISTHIIEVGEELKKSTDNLQFVYLPTVMDGNTPKYTYALKPGITKDRQGMMIIENEGILDVLAHHSSQ